MAQDKRHSSPSALRNREPIRQVLVRFLPERSRVLEIAAGTGEHALYLSDGLDVAHWWPSDLGQESIDSINAWRNTQARAALHPAIRMDISKPVDELIRTLEQAGVGSPEFDAIVCINMVHISPWQATEGLLDAAGALLREKGILYLYGPWKRRGKHTAPSNEAFDADLKSRNPAWGLRDLETVEELASRARLKLLEVIAMPANNFSLVFQRF